MHSSSFLAQTKRKGKEKGKEKEWSEETLDTKLAKDAEHFYPFGHQYALKSHFLEVAKFLFLQHQKYADSISFAEKYIGLVQAKAKKLLNQHGFQPQEFEPLFIKKACRLLLAQYTQFDLNTVLSMAELHTCLWLSGSGLSMEDGMNLVVRGQREISLEEWKQDKASCIEKINEIKKYLQVKPIIKTFVLSELSRIIHSPYSFLMSKKETDNKVNALIIALKEIQAVNNLDELCDAINQYLINNPDIYSARNKLKFIFSEKDKQNCQTKSSLITIINQFGLRDRIEDKTQDEADDIELTSKPRQTI